MNSLLADFAKIAISLLAIAMLAKGCVYAPDKEYENQLKQAEKWQQQPLKFENP